MWPYSAEFTGSASVHVVASSVFGRVYRECKCSCGGFFCIRQSLPGVQVFMWWLLLYSAGFTGSSSVPVVASSVFGRVYPEFKCSCGGFLCIRQGLPGVQMFMWWLLLYSAGFTGSANVHVVASSVFGRVYRECKCSCGGFFCIRQGLPGVQVFLWWLLLYSAGFTRSSSVPVVASSVFGRVYWEFKCSCGGVFCIRQSLPGVQVFMWWLLLYSAGFTGSSSVPVVSSSVFGRVYRECKCSCGGVFCIRQGLPGVQVFLWWRLLYSAGFTGSSSVPVVAPSVFGRVYREFKCSCGGVFCIRQGLPGVQVFLWWLLLYSAGFTGSSSVPVVASSVFGRVYREFKCSCGGVFCIRQGLPGVQVFLWWRLLYSAGFTGSASVPVVASSVFGRVYREFKCSCGGVFCIRQGLPGVQVFLWWRLLYSAGFTGSSSVPVVASSVFGRVYREFKCSCGGFFCIRQGLPGVQVFLWWRLVSLVKFALVAWKSSSSSNYNHNPLVGHFFVIKICHSDWGKNSTCQPLPPSRFGAKFEFGDPEYWAAEQIGEPKQQGACCLKTHCHYMNLCWRVIVLGIHKWKVSPILHRQYTWSRVYWGVPVPSIEVKSCSLCSWYLCVHERARRVCRLEGRWSLSSLVRVFQSILI